MFPQSDQGNSGTSQGNPQASQQPQAPATPPVVDPRLLQAILISALPMILPQGQQSQQSQSPDLSSMMGGGGDMSGMGGGMPPSIGGGMGQPQPDQSQQIIQALMQQQQQMQQAMMMLTQTMSEVSHGIQMLAQAITMPKVIIKDEMGRPIGSKPLLPALTNGAMQ